ncbi:MAG: LysR family transcriptional regulator [Lawsonibacter sp.]|nr:LysR family transcriptional regulator [Lawsonibacter sp.]
MTLLQLQYFKTLAQVLHYTQAANQLHIAQPSLSYSIKELEKELGVKLFEKDSRHIRLTIYGEQFLPYAEQALSMIDEGVGVLRQMSNSAQQIVRLGYFHSISASLIPSTMMGVYGQEKNQSIRFQFTEAPSFDLFQMLKKGEIDLAFCLHHDDDLESVTIMRQPLYLAVPEHHPLAKRESVCFEDFAREPIVMLDKPSSLRHQLDEVYTRHGLSPDVVFEVRECNAALQYVALRFGVSVLPQVPAMKNEKVVVIPISDDTASFVRTVYFSWMKRRPLSPAARRVRDYIVANYATP